MKNRNQHRLLNDDQIKNITAQVAYDLIKYANESAEHLMNFYLNGDAQGMFETISDWIESAENEVLSEKMDIDPKEENDNFHPNYEI